MSCCVRLQVAKSLTGLTLAQHLPPIRNNMQQGVQLKRTQHVTSNNARSCLRPFARGFKGLDLMPVLTSLELNPH